MKIKWGSILALFLLFALMFCGSVFAEEQVFDWPTSGTVTVAEGNDVVYRYVPSETGQYTLKGMQDLSFGVEVRDANGDPINFNNWLNENTGEMYDFYTLNAGQEYQIRFCCGGPYNPGAGKKSADVSILKWSNRLSLPDATDLKENEQKTVSLSLDETKAFFFSPTVSGLYCLGQSGSDVHIGIGASQKAPGDYGHSPEEKGEWKTDTQHGMLYSLVKGETYTIYVTLNNKENATDTFWIRPGDAPKNEYQTWGINETKTVTLKQDEQVNYYFTPAETGRHMVLTGNGIRFSIWDGDNELGKEFSTADARQCQVFELVAGKEYVVRLEKWGLQESVSSGSFKIEKVGPVKSVDIFVSLFDQFGYTLCLDIDPICGAYDGVKWSVSDPSVFSIRAEHGSILELKVLKKGTATITAKVGDVVASMELNSEHKTPVLTEGKTFNMKIQNVAGAEFIPSASGKYQVTVIPDREMIFHFFGDLEKYPLFTKADFSEKTVFTVNLTAGQKYTLIQISGRCSVLVTRVGGAFIPNENANTSSQNTGASSDTVSQDTGSISDGATQNPGASSDTVPQDPAGSLQNSGSDGATSTDLSSSQTDVADGPSSDSSNSSAEAQDKDNHITKTDVEEVVFGAIDKVITFFVNQGHGTTIDADALTYVADSGCGMNLNFSNDVKISLDNEVLKSVSGDALSESVLVQAKEEQLADLNESQQKALNGENVELILNLELKANGQGIHELGGKAGISIPNPDKNKEWSVLYVAQDGSLESMDVVCEENITFYTEHFSHFVLVSVEKGTGISPVVWIVSTVVAVVLLGGGVVAFILLKKRKPSDS